MSRGERERKWGIKKSIKKECFSEETKKARNPKERVTKQREKGYTLRRHLAISRKLQGEQGGNKHVSFTKFVLKREGKGRQGGVN